MWACVRQPGGEGRGGYGVCGWRAAAPPVILVEKLLCQSREAATCDAEGDCDGRRGREAAALSMQNYPKCVPHFWVLGTN